MSSDSSDDSELTSSGASSSGSSSDDEHQLPSSAPTKKPFKRTREQSWDDAAAKEQGKPASRRVEVSQTASRASSPPLPQTPPPPPPGYDEEGSQAQGTILGGFPISEGFYQLIRETRNMTEAELVDSLDGGPTSSPSTSSSDRRRRETIKPRPQTGNPEGAESASDDLPADEDDFLLLTEVIEAYLSVAKNADPRIDGLNRADHAQLRALAATLRHTLGTDGREYAMPAALAVASPLAQRVVNTAPPGRIPWECIGVDEERGAVHWAADLTAGRAPEPWRNALLSEGAKAAMYAAHKADPVKYSAAVLAQAYRIRPQRAMAILALKEREEAAAGGEGALHKAITPVVESSHRDLGDAAVPVPVPAPVTGAGALRAQREEFRRLMEDMAFPCKEAAGSGERHFVTLSSFPAYAEIETSTLLKRLEEVVGKQADDIEPEELTPDIARQVFGVKSVEELQEELAEKEEASLVAEFQKALEFNLERIGQGLSKGNRRIDVPKRPKEGWSLLVTPLGHNKDTGVKDMGGMQAERVPFVARPDGSRRELNADEALLIERKTPRPRRRIP